MFNFGRKTAESEITPQELQQQLSAGTAATEQLLVLDVRQPDEYQAGHLQGALLIPLDQLALRLDELPRDRPIVAMCRSGNRSGVATGMLKRAGYNATNLKGGILAWAKQGLPVERPA